MANNYDDPTASDGPAAADHDGTIEAMKEQISQLTEELTALKSSIAERAEQVAENAAGWFDTASENASRATGALKSKAQTVSGIVQEQSRHCIVRVAGWRPYRALGWNGARSGTAPAVVLDGAAGVLLGDRERKTDRILFK